MTHSTSAHSTAIPIPMTITDNKMPQIDSSLLHNQNWNILDM